ncbi:putative Phosphatidylinositol synthase [Paratrimastix pyriformis]|uniref:CDP-diacylglycerol--inositol 3-phosphatidyltransferase n=1 Tax=Paratrimastix pyriformis TaxID=342808 RepID=A0ABQ8USD7_9EUKA|nr:putative Phosphatidylinositol synthase [Paratrimastix pyriformis]|eukprot:GAFH01004580.1.p2 GENE.GAFH01004580.1~~GAFH01004580.1.p2  ORF type:complete len:230 (+),score=36.69 GAFH01004580.1:17-706(+)
MQKSPVVNTWLAIKKVIQDLTSWSVYLYVPNLIGYSRVILSLLSFIFYQSPYIFLPCYAISFVLDAVDGTAARAFDQCSQFGAILDMFTDRGSVACLYAILCIFYPKYAAIFLIGGFLDITSHYVHMYKASMYGEKNHKKLPPGTFWFLRLYYEKRKFMGACCIGNESFLLGLYMMHFHNGSCPVCQGLMAILGFLWLCKAFAHICQMCSGMWWMAEFDRQARRSQQAK